MPVSIVSNFQLAPIISLLKRSLSLRSVQQIPSRSHKKFSLRNVCQSLICEQLIYSVWQHSGFQPNYLETRVLEWHFTGNMAYPRAAHTASLLTNGKVLVTGGFCYPDENSAKMYDPLTDNRTIRANSNMPRLSRTTFELIARKNSDAVSLNSVELYDPTTGNWTTTGNLSIPRDSHTASVLSNGKVLVIGGVSDGSGKEAGNSAELYDPSIGSWITVGNMTYVRFWHTASVLTNGKVLVVGGSNGDRTSNTAELYDPSAGNWTITGKLSTRRTSHTAIPLKNGKVLVTGGVSDNAVLRSTELYDPSTGNWTRTGDLSIARTYHTACLLNDGKVLVTGGAFDSLGIVIATSTELYNPSTGHWTMTGDLNVPRMSATTSVLPDGKVLVAGGELYDSETLSSAELYDPSTGHWTLVDDLNNARYLHTATALTNGKVLVTGGFNQYIQTAAELYERSAERS